MQSSQAEVAKLCRKYLKSNNIKAKVTSKGYSGGDSVSVTVFDQHPNTIKMIEKEFSKYQYGHFNGMEDIYEYSNCNDDIPQTKYLFVDNCISNEMNQKALDYIRENFKGGEELTSVYTKLGATERIFNDWVTTVIHRVINGSLDCDFWESK